MSEFIAHSAGAKAWHVEVAAYMQQIPPQQACKIGHDPGMVAMGASSIIPARSQC